MLGSILPELCIAQCAGAGCCAQQQRSCSLLTATERSRHSHAEAYVLVSLAGMMAAFRILIYLVSAAVAAMSGRIRPASPVL